MHRAAGEWCSPVWESVILMLFEGLTVDRAVFLLPKILPASEAVSVSNVDSGTTTNLQGGQKQPPCVQGWRPGIVENSSQAWQVLVLAVDVYS